MYVEKPYAVKWKRVGNAKSREPPKRRKRGEAQERSGRSRSERNAGIQRSECAGGNAQIGMPTKVSQMMSQISLAIKGASRKATSQGVKK